MTKYTFLLPAYKATYFEEALMSIQSQSYKDFFCIVSDDCSPEDLKRIFDKVCGNDRRFTYRRNEKNIGGKSLVAHWNLLVELCETNYFMMAGDDDIYHSDFLAEIDKLQVKYPTAGVIRSRSQYIDYDGVVTDQDSMFPEYQDVLLFLFNRYHCFYISGILNYAFRKDVIKREKQFLDFPIAWFSDEACVIACSKYGICTTSDVLTDMRISGINLSCQRNTTTSRMKLEASKLFNDWIFEFIENNCKPKSVLDENRLIAVKEAVLKSNILSVATYSDSISFVGRYRLYKELKNKGYLGSTVQSLKYLFLIMKGIH